MKITIKTGVLLLTTVALAAITTSQTTAQQAGCCNNQVISGDSYAGCSDMTQPTCPRLHGFTGLPARAVYAVRDHYSPQPGYAYSRRGITAQRTDAWNQFQMTVNPWHGGYSNWRWGQPVALVVPPTAAFQSEYNWGVAETRSLPIYHQFGRGGAGTIVTGEVFTPTPYWPSSTSQFGVYPVRGPWHH